MKHHFLDHYWTIDSPIHKFDPRLKIIVSLFLLVAVVVTPNDRIIDHILFLPFLIAALVISKLPFGAILRRMLVVLPLVLIISISLPFVKPGRPVLQFDFFVPITLTSTGLETFISVIIKATFATWIMTILTASTQFRDLLAAMQQMKFPRIFTSLLGFVYRYIFLFIDELEHLNIGRRSRSFGNNTVLAVKGLGWMISSLFVRSFDRGERIYQAMCARGFDGVFITTTEMKITQKEVITASVCICIIIIIKIAGGFYG